MENNATLASMGMGESWAGVIDGHAVALLKGVLERVQNDESLGMLIHPPKETRLRVFQSDPDKIKVVIVGQDPYHTPGKAHGLAFSVPEGTKPPPSLVNIFKEISTEIAPMDNPENGSLLSWEKQGVLLLNSTLTVVSGKPGSHAGIGWGEFTDAVISSMSKTSSNLVFLLWGAHAMGKESLVDKNRHLVLKAPHPSPFSARKGFFGCGHFKATNQWLESHGKAPVDWTRSA